MARARASTPSRSLIGKVLALAGPIPHAAPWNTQGGRLYGAGMSDRFTQLNTMSTSGTLFAIVQLLSTGQAKGRWHMYRTDEDGRVRYSSSDQGSDMRVEVLRHLALKLWKRPNDFMSGYQFREIGWQFMELVGEWYWVLDRGPSGMSPPIAMWPVRPDRMEPVPDREKFLKGWVYTGPNGESVPLSTNEVIQLRYPHPSDFYRGMSPVQSILANIDSSRYTAEWSRNFFLNSAIPGGIVTFAKRLSDDEFDEFTDRWREQHQGVARGHRVGVLEQGATWSQNTYTMRDMQFTDLNKLDRDVIREAYRIHQAMLGNSDDVNRANAQTAEEVHVSWHEVTRLERTKDTLDEFYLPTFGETGHRVEFDFENPTPTSSNDANDELTAKSKAYALLVANEVNPESALEIVGFPKDTASGPAIRPAAIPVATGPSSEFTDEEVSQAARAVRNAFRKPSLAGEMSDEEANALAVIIRQTFNGSLNGNGHKELV